MKHSFTDVILSVLTKHFANSGQEIFNSSPLLQYLNFKTRSANKGSKSRSSFANLYALYVLLENYVQNGFQIRAREEYQKYVGARFTDLLHRTRELPFGSKLQNHALNSRLNDEFSKYFPNLNKKPILRDQQAQRYWINDNLLFIAISRNEKIDNFNIAQAIIDIIDAYIHQKKASFISFLETCQKIADFPANNTKEALNFINEQLQPNVDARIFEIISFSILKSYFGMQSVYWKFSNTSLVRESLILFKTGRTNANDGGIDFVMKPLGRFFQVSETIDINKYFLDIDKIECFPLTFVVKTNDDPEIVRAQLLDQANSKNIVENIVDRYMEAIEEIINIPILIKYFELLAREGKVKDVLNEVILQSRIEFNYDEIKNCSK